MDDREKMKLWVDTWHNAEKALDRVKAQELRSAHVKSATELLDGMLEWAFHNRTERNTSGLVELQSYFKKLAES